MHNIISDKIFKKKPKTETTEFKSYVFSTNQLSLELPKPLIYMIFRVARLKRQIFLLYFCFTRKPISQCTALSKDVTSNIEIRQKSFEYQLMIVN